MLETFWVPVDVGVYSRPHLALAPGRAAASLEGDIFPVGRLKTGSVEPRLGVVQCCAVSM